MKYQVEWGPVAEQQLAAVYLVATRPDDVTVAVAWLDHRLTFRPLLTGRARNASVNRVAFRDPIGIEFEVIEDDKRVIVQGVFATE